MRGFQNPEKMPDAFKSEIIELQATVENLENRIKELQIVKKDIEESNEESLKARREKLDSIITEQHRLKNIIVDGQSELLLNQESLENDQKSHSQEIKKHQDSVSDWEKRKQEFTDGIKRLEEDLKSSIAKNMKSFEELNAKNIDLNEKMFRVKRLTDEIDVAIKANEEKSQKLDALEEELNSKAEALNSDKQAHGASIASHQKSVSDFESEKQNSITRMTKSEETLAEARRLKNDTDDQYLRILDLRAETNQKINMLASQEQINQQTLQNLIELKNKLISLGGPNAQKLIDIEVIT